MSRNQDITVVDECLLIMFVHIQIETIFKNKLIENMYNSKKLSW